MFNGGVEVGWDQPIWASQQQAIATVGRAESSQRPVVIVRKYSPSVGTSRLLGVHIQLILTLNKSTNISDFIKVNCKQNCAKICYLFTTH